MTRPSWQPRALTTGHPNLSVVDGGYDELAWSAYSELRRDERLGPTCARLLHRIITALVRGPSGGARFPTLEGSWNWTEDDRVQATHEIFL